MSAYPHVFSPLAIGSMRVKNRLLMSAMSINFGVDGNGFVTDQLSAYFEARARGGVGERAELAPGTSGGASAWARTPSIWPLATIRALAMACREGGWTGGFFKGAAKVPGVK